MRRVSKEKFVVLVSLFTAMAVSPLAWGHGAYDWIRGNGYKSHHGVPCCGVDDCYRMTGEEISIGDSMYRLVPLGVSFPKSRTLPSQDQYFWVCVDETEIRCFFAPNHVLSGLEEPGPSIRISGTGQ